VFGQPEIVLGVIAPSACALLPQRIPPGAAAELVLTGDPIAAERAYQIGLVARVVPDDRVEQEARELAQRIARHSAAAVRLTKRALRSESIARGAAALERAGEIYLNELMQTHDAVEGLKAFLDKRQPTWAHR
jgi:cyclohexa-1,5-dienecarbonyl-CoA hydratase